MIHWKIPFGRLRNEIYNTSKKGISEVSLADLEFAINRIETDILIDHEMDVLEGLNETPFNKFHKQYLEQIKAYIQLVKEENEQHRLYTQLIITSGYAAYFGLWSLVQEHTKMTDLSIILVTISVISFITLEIAKVGIEGWNIRIKNEALLKAQAEDNILIKQQRVLEANSFSAHKDFWMSKIWGITYPISAFTGLGGLAIMLWSLISKLNIWN